MNPDGDAIASYPYRRVPLTPQIVAHLTKELFAGKLAERQTIVEEVQKLIYEARRIATKSQRFCEPCEEGVNKYAKGRGSGKSVPWLLEDSPKKHRSNSRLRGRRDGQRRK